MVTSGTTNIGEKKHNDARNEAAAGIGKGRISGVQGAHEPTEEEKKKLREQKAQNEMAYQSMEDAQALHELYHELEELEAQRAALETKEEVLVSQITNIESKTEQFIQELRDSGQEEDAKIIEDMTEMQKAVVVDYEGKEYIVFKDEDNPGARYIVDRNDPENKIYINEFDEPDKTNAWKYINGQAGQKFGNDYKDPNRPRELEANGDVYYSKEKETLRAEYKKIYYDENNVGKYEKHQDLDQVNQDISATEEKIATTNDKITDIKDKNTVTDPSLSLITNDKDRAPASSNITLISDPDNQQTSLTEANTFAMAASPDQPQPEETQEPEPVILTSENDSTLTATQSNTV